VPAITNMARHRDGGDVELHGETIRPRGRVRCCCATLRPPRRAHLDESAALIADRSRTTTSSFGGYGAQFFSARVWCPTRARVIVEELPARCCRTGRSSIARPSSLCGPSNFIVGIDHMPIVFAARRSTGES